MVSGIQWKIPRHMKQGMGDDKKAENKSYYENRGIMSVILESANTDFKKYCKYVLKIKAIK